MVSNLKVFYYKEGLYEKLRFIIHSLLYINFIIQFYSLLFTEHEILNVEGSLGGFQIRDVTPDGNIHQCIVSVGQDPTVEKSQDVFSRLNSGVFNSTQQSNDPENAHKAFSFNFVRPLTFSSAENREYNHYICYLSSLKLVSSYIYGIFSFSALLSGGS